MYYAHETTPCCMRQLQKPCPDCASWEVEIDYLGSDGQQEAAYKMTKACTPCTFLCINRPVTYVYDYDGNLLGGIKDPCAIIPTNMTFEIQDENGDAMYWAESGCCQWGICCPFPCGPCKTVEFPIKDTNGKSVGELVSLIGNSTVLHGPHGKGQQMPHWQQPLSAQYMASPFSSW